MVFTLPCYKAKIKIKRKHGCYQLGYIYIDTYFKAKLLRNSVEKREVKGVLIFIRCTTRRHAMSYKM